ncbi:glycosyl transferase [Halalkalibacterium halodurans]|uniref:ATP-grasp fold amidoligase family protein n=1 Tax=Halalkalibacterium halodurans TaxID=86665 RepID=UPI00106881AA|nr:ATP-grasp fold amidoligase family protein [Halalkalibacterium halodurans]TES53593.1 glycosyl transferase [Halalkalibacterium halodurans]
MSVKIKPMIREILSTISPKVTSKILYRSAFGKKLDLKNPKTLNEKLMWLKLNSYYNNPLITTCADKYKVRNYIKELGYEEILNELIGCWDNTEEIEWDKLPDKFVLKCNHGAGYNLICQDKKNFNIDEAKRKLNNWLKEDYWKKRAELNYKFIDKKIICEKFIETHDGKLPADYKLYCFNGKPDCVMVCLDREKGKPRLFFFNRDWKLLDYTSDSIESPNDYLVEKPEGIDKMFEYAEILSKPFPFVRVDFYLNSGKVIFGELTFTPGAALYSNILPKADDIFGKKIKLPNY